MKNWKINSWKKYPVKHIPNYKDEKELNMVLNKLNCNVTAVTSKKENLDYLKSLGAKNIINSADLDKDARPLDKGLYDGAVDTVGGNLLANILVFLQTEGITSVPTYSLMYSHSRNP